MLASVEAIYASVNDSAGAIPYPVRVLEGPFHGFHQLIFLYVLVVALMIVACSPSFYDRHA